MELGGYHLKLHSHCAVCITRCVDSLELCCCHHTPPVFLSIPHPILRSLDDPFIPIAEAHVVRDNLGLTAGTSYFEPAGCGHFQQKAFPALRDVITSLIASASVPSPGESLLSSIAEEGGAGDDADSVNATGAASHSSAVMGEYAAAALDGGSDGDHDSDSASSSKRASHPRQPQPQAASHTSRTSLQSISSNTTLNSQDFQWSFGGHGEGTAGAHCQTLGFIGVGTIANAMVRGLCSDGAGADGPHCLLSPRNTSKTAKLAADFPGQVGGHIREQKGGTTLFCFRFAASLRHLFPICRSCSAAY